MASKSLGTNVRESLAQVDHVCDLIWHFSCSSVSYYCHLRNRGRMTLPFHLPTLKPPTPRRSASSSALCLTFYHPKALGIGRPTGRLSHRYSRHLLKIGFIFYKCHSGAYCSYPGQVGHGTVVSGPVFPWGTAPWTEPLFFLLCFQVNKPRANRDSYS